MRTFSVLPNLDSTSYRIHIHNTAYQITYQIIWRWEQWESSSHGLLTAKLYPLPACNHCTQEDTVQHFKTIHMSIIFTRNFQPRKSLRYFIRKNWPVRFFPVARNKHHVQYDLLAAINFGSFESCIPKTYWNRYYKCGKERELLGIKTYQFYKNLCFIFYS
jgi:hypothetical protein